MKYITIVVLSVLAVSCTKETYVEGMIPVSKSFTSGFSAPARNSVTTQAKLNIEGVEYPLNFTFNRFKVFSAYPSYSAAANDSILACNISSNMQLYIQNSHIMKFNKGDEFPVSLTGAYTNVPLFVALKKPPYAGGFNSLAQINAQPLHFGLSQEGYICFNVTNASIPVFGWARIQISEQEIQLTSYGYRTYQPGKAGL